MSAMQVEKEETAERPPPILYQVMLLTAFWRIKHIDLGYGSCELLDLCQACMSAVSLSQTGCPNFRGQAVDVAIGIQTARFAAFDWIVPASFANADNAWADIIGDDGTGENLAPIIEHADHVAVFDTTSCGILGVDDAGFAPSDSINVT